MYTPDMNNGTNIFVFGSNLLGRHGRGAALEAKLHWGAKYGVGEGRTGQAYAFPTKFTPYMAMSLASIGEFKHRFYGYCGQHPELTFLLTKVGCGLAGHRELHIARMFANAPSNVVKPDNWDILAAQVGEGYSEYEERRLT